MFVLLLYVFAWVRYCGWYLCVLCRGVDMLYGLDVIVELYSLEAFFEL